MKYISFALAAAAWITGSWAAWKWWGASLVRIDPGWGLPGASKVYQVPG
ncbi:MAG TPA: hypothetical protein VGC09_07520 [Rhodopila sp.]